MTDPDLPQHDVSDQTSAEKIALTKQVGHLLRAELDGSKREAAEQLARLLARDATQSVRQALAMALVECPYLPDDVARRIADDVDDVASSFLRTSQINVEALEKLAGEIAGHASLFRQKIDQDDVFEALGLTRGFTEDDLTAIKGIGPKMAEKLYEQGIRNFSNLAAINRKFAEELDEALKTQGRILRDDWIGQAKKMMG